MGLVPMSPKTTPSAPSMIAGRNAGAASGASGFAGAAVVTCGSQVARDAALGADRFAVGLGQTCSPRASLSAFGQLSCTRDRHPHDHGKADRAWLSRVRVHV